MSASLYELIGSEAERIPPFLREASASEVAIIVSSADATRADAAARRLAEEFPVSSDLPPGALEFIRANRAGLVTREAAGLLQTPEGRAKIARRAIRRLYSSPVPPVLGYEDDPFGLTDAWLMSLATARTQKTAEGWPCLTTNGVTRILLKHRLDPKIACDIDATIATLDKMRRLGAADTGAGPPVFVSLAGAPVHAALSARRCKDEIGALTLFSLAVIAALALFVFRSVRWFPLLAASLLVAALAGGVTLLAFFREIHAVTLVMGTTVLGLVIDYSFHWLLSSDEEKPIVCKNLLVSFLTTEIALAPLMLASIPVLRQSAVFLGAGLAAALAYVLAAYPRGKDPNTDGRGPNAAPVLRLAVSPASRLAVSPVSRLAFPALPVLILVLAVIGLFRVSVKTDVRSLYRPTAALAEAERQRAQFGEFDFAALPSLDAQRENAVGVRLLYGEHGAKLMESLGVRSLPVPLEPTERLARPLDLMNEIFGAWTTESLRRLALSMLVLVVVVACFFRRRSVCVLMPSVLALLAVAGLLGWMNAPVNLFHILAAFLLIGMGIDYAVFLQSRGRGVMRPALSSLLTSMAGFGALAFVSFPVVASFGIVLGVGLPVAFVTALFIRGHDVPSRQGAIVQIASDRMNLSSADAFETNASTEYGASLLGMETLFLLYRALGLRALHLMSASVGFCVWLFSSPVRRASPSVGKVFLFTRSLADKLVVLAEGRRLPIVETDGTPDAAQFVSDVQAGKGVFVLSSHVGTIEVLTALGECDRTFHAWMDFDRTTVFNRFYLRHARRRKVIIHPISEFGMASVFEAGDWIDAGDCLVMAGDRGKGAFRFAAAFDHPVYFVACVAERGCRYRAVIRRLPADRSGMRTAFESMCEKLRRHFPGQAFDWNV